MVDEDYFIFKNKSSLNLDIVIEDGTMSPIQDAEREVEILEIPGRDGFLTVDKGRRKPVTKVVSGVLLNGNNKYIVRDWLKGNGKLMLSNDEGVFYKASIIEAPIFTDHWSKGWNIDIEFLCQPYGYLHEGQNTITINTKGTEIHNNYEESQPYFKITGSGKVDLFINNNKIILDLDEYVEIDSELKESWKNSLPKPFKGSFPVFKQGVNTITWDGNINNIEVIPRWRK